MAPEGIKSPWPHSNLLRWLVSLVLSFTLTAVAKVKHDLRWLLIPSALLAIIVLWIPATAWIKGWVRRAVVAVGILLIGSFYYWLNGWLKTPDLRAGCDPSGVYGPFKSTYGKYCLQLGQPQQLIEGAVNYEAVQAWHQHATVLWAPEPPQIFILLNGSHRLVSRPEDNYAAETKYYDEAKLKQMFSDAGFVVPPPLLPPWGGVAKNWLADPPAWEWIGWRESHCVIGSAAIKASDFAVQEFDHGYIEGPLRFYPNGGPCQIFVLLPTDSGDGVWYSHTSAATAPRC